LANVRFDAHNRLWSGHRAQLDRRNIVAHPSTVVVVQSQADDVVTDLVNNVVLALT
jgi:hypothetical protein